MAPHAGLGVVAAAGLGIGSRRLVEADTGAVAIWGDYLLFVRGATLYAQHLDPERLQLNGDPFQIGEGVALEALPVHQMAAISASARGHIVYRFGSAFQERQFLWFDRSGKEIGRIGSPDRGHKARAFPLTVAGSRCTATSMATLTSGCSKLLVEDSPVSRPTPRMTSTRSGHPTASACCSARTVPVPIICTKGGWERIPKSAR